MPGPCSLAALAALLLAAPAAAFSAPGRSPRSALLAGPSTARAAPLAPRPALPGAVTAKAAVSLARMGLRAEDEPDDAFISTWEKKPDSEKIKSPVIIGGLVVLVLPFLVGISVLATGGVGGN